MKTLFTRVAFVFGTLISVALLARPASAEALEVYNPPPTEAGWHFYKAYTSFEKCQAVGLVLSDQNGWFTWGCYSDETTGPFDFGPRNLWYWVAP
jgi:hypothetical protein